MRKVLYIILLFLVIISVTGCSSSSTEESQMDKSSSGSLDNSSQEMTEEKIQENSDEVSEQEVIKEENMTSSNQDDGSYERMVIYTADLSIQVSSYEETLTFIQKQLEIQNGYIVESNSYTVEEGKSVEGTITVRIPQEKFRDFLNSVETGSTKVVNKSISGQDVTEEYVDLESRLKSKEVVEKRLLDFMEKAEKTEELLKISNDLSAVQEEIEQIKGRMNFLKNKVNLATVTLHVIEDKVNIPTLDNKELNTWDKTKKQFMDSVNFLLNIVSAFTIFIVGSLPVLLVLGGLLTIALITIKKRKKTKDTKPPM
ncbi:hypothetical protein JOC75_001493 [Metabacillus crassostreae]|uniref:DUF4349 domain-containing protein n=1 Tax=Metabacillus crassostreae TaxID=929098 RepID=UPI0019563025|nr:DUF4349 domain-containing protein [Metabacillus crassostreae]MBM7603523.1 hypothetical protein [Metabacillus crassostreae]